MVFVYLEGYADGAPSYTTCPDANHGIQKVRGSNPLGSTNFPSSEWPIAMIPSPVGRSLLPILLPILLPNVMPSRLTGVWCTSVGVRSEDSRQS